jgi:hypothetical protein
MNRWQESRAQNVNGSTCTIPANLTNLLNQVRCKSRCRTPRARHWSWLLARLDCANIPPVYVPGKWAWKLDLSAQPVLDTWKFGWGNGLVYFLIIIFTRSKKAVVKFTCDSHVLQVIELAWLQIMIAELSGNDSTTQTIYLVFKKEI